MSTTKPSAQVPKIRFPGFAGEWNRSALEEHISLLSGYAFQSEFFADEGQRLITPKNFTKFGRASFTSDNTKKTTEEVAERFQCNAGDLLVLLTDLTPTCELLGKPALLVNEDAPCLLNQRIAKVNFETRDLDPAFLANLMLSEAYVRRIKDTATGTTVRHSSNRIVLSFEASFPKIAEQQKIAAFLMAVDGRIEQLSRKKALLEATKKGVMQQLFTQTLRFQDDHGHDFPDWEEKTLGEVVELLSGQHLGPDDYNENGEGVPYFTGPSDFTSDPSSFKKWTTQNTKIAKPDSVLITVKGNGVGRLMYSTLDQVALGRQLMALRSSSCDNRYLYQYLLTKAQEFVALGSGNLIPGLSRGDILTMALPLPSLPEQTKIAGFLSALEEKIAAVGEQMRQTQAWKKGLLQQMFV